MRGRERGGPKECFCDDHFFPLIFPSLPQAFFFPLSWTVEQKRREIVLFFLSAPTASEKKALYERLYIALSAYFDWQPVSCKEEASIKNARACVRERESERLLFVG